MRRLLLSMVLLISLAMGSGCFLPIYSGDPARRTKQLIYTSEDLRNFLEEWERFWFMDQPGHLTPYNTHGGTFKIAWCRFCASGVRFYRKVH